MSHPLAVLSASVACGSPICQPCSFAAALAQRIVPALLGSRDEAVERDRHVAGGVGHQHLSEIVAGCVAPIYSNHIRHRGSTSLMRVDKLCVGGGSRCH